MWRAIGASARGTSHIVSDLPCQDAWAQRTAFVGGEFVTILAIADGAGSAKASDLGSQECVAHLVHAISTSDFRISEMDQDVASTWLESGRKHLEALAVEKELSPRDLACTALVAVLGESESIFFQVGDGAWIAEYQGHCEPITWPLSGEYANETTFLSSPNWKSQMQFRRWASSTMSIAGFTDGLQGLALHFASKAVHAPFFAPMFGALHRTDNVNTLQAPLLQFLNAPVLNERTDDDKTLVLACREKLKLRHGAD